MRAKIYLDDGAKSFLLILLFSQLLFTNGIILLGGLIIFFILFYNLQQPYKPSIFTIILVYHFLQISAGIWQSNNLGKDINYRSDSTDIAIILSYIGLLCIFLPIIYYQNKIPKLSLEQFKKSADTLSINKTFRVYVIGFFVLNALTGIAFFIPSLTQIIFSLGNIKWFLFLLFGFQSILKNRMRKEFYFFCILEFALGFFSYFSEFKTIIFYILMLLLTLLAVIELRKMILVSVALVAFFFAGVFWTSIKGEYRLFLNKGSKTQTVQVEKEDAFNKLKELSEKQNENTFNSAVGGFFDRLQYTYHLAKTMDRVPRVLPYQDGTNWGTTLQFVLTPRILNPNKGVYDASEKASKYTGMRFAGVKKGTSISLGYFADGYIDFGYVGMFIPLLILGFIYGASYFYFVKNSSNNYVFNFAVVSSMYLEMIAMESDSIFIAGRLYVTLLVFFLLKRFFFPRLMNYIRMPLKPIEQETA
jgi:hypothetical protein